MVVVKNISRAALCGVIAFFCLGCDWQLFPLNKIDHYDIGIHKIALTIPSDGYSQLMKSGHLNEWVGAVIVVNQLSYDVKMRLHGNAARKHPRKSFKLVSAFENNQREQVSNIVLSFQYKDKSYCRYLLADYFFRKAGLKCPHVEPVGVFINGEYEGLYLYREVVDEVFFSRRGLPVSSLYRINLHGHFTFEHGMSVSQGFSKELPDEAMSYTDLEELIMMLDRGITENNRSELEQILDIENTLSYYAVAILINHSDGIVNNFYLYHNQLTGKFEFIPWDLDATFSNIGNSLPQFQNGLFEQLITIDTYEKYLNQRIQELFDVKEAVDTLYAYKEKIESAYGADPYFSFMEADIDKYVADVEQYLYAMAILIATDTIAGKAQKVQ